jgi:scyllo-inositol 2-dehydrogenase (NADP+)
MPFGRAARIMPGLMSTQETGKSILHVVVAGYGYAGRTFHAPLVRMEPRMRLLGIVARDAMVRAGATARLGCRGYADVEQAIADPQVDLIVLATPTDTHAPLAIAAMRAGKHVVVDKPMALNAGECDQMIEVSQQTGKLLSVFHNRRWDSDYLTLRSLLDTGELGDLRWLELSWNRHGLSKRGPWKNDPARGGSRLIDVGVHLIDQAIQLFGKPVGVSGRLHRDWPESNTTSCAHIGLTFEGGQTCVIDVGSMTRHIKPRIVAVGTNATYVHTGDDPQEPAMAAGDWNLARTVAPVSGKLLSESGEHAVATVPGDWRFYYANIADVLLSGRPPAIDLADVRAVMAVVDEVCA